MSMVVQYGDRLACLVFNLRLEKAIRDSGIQTSGCQINHIVRFLGYTDDTGEMLLEVVN